MLQLANKTSFEGMIFATPDPEGVDSLYAVLKATFAISPKFEPIEKQEPVSMEEQYHGEPDRSSVKKPSDFGLIKPGTDVVLTGHAFPQGGSVARQAEVRLTVGPLHRSVMVFGDRLWERGAVGVNATPPALFERMPLVWERAFGGTDISGGLPVAENRNPVGTGFLAKNGAKQAEGMRLPNLEDARQLIGSPGDCPAPAGLAPICAHWEPRRSYAGTYDAEWQANRAPYLPKNFDARFFQIAPQGLTSAGYLRGGEPVEVAGASPSGPIRFVLPVVRIQVNYHLEQGSQARQANLDTVWIDMDRLRLSLLWRAGLACDKSIRRVREVEVSAA